MTKILGIIAILVLAAIFYFGHPIVATPVDVPTTVEPQVKTAPKVEAPPAKVEPQVKTEPKIEAPVEPVKKIIKKKTKKTVGPNPTTYYRVSQGGGRGVSVACTSVRPFAEGKTEAELAAYAKQYAVTVEELKRYFVCTP